MAETKTKKGDRYGCEECGLVLVVDQGCECGDNCELICCDEPMTKQRGEKKTASKAPVRRTSASQPAAKRTQAKRAAAGSRR